MTQTRLVNNPSNEIVAVMKITAEKIFEPIREYFDKPISISSFFRTKEVNRKIGGARNSQHLLGEAIDIDAQILGGLTNKDIFEYAKEYLEFDQLIWEEGDEDEPDWIHISYTEKRKNRYEVLKKIDISEIK